MTSLAPCPFCGSSKAEPFKSEFPGQGDVWTVFCNDCESEGPHHAHHDQAVAAWNNRLPSSAALERQGLGAGLIEECAKIADGIDLYKDGFSYSRAEACKATAASIRALAQNPPAMEVGATGESSTDANHAAPPVGSEGGATVDQLGRERDHWRSQFQIVNSAHSILVAGEEEARTEIASLREKLGAAEVDAAEGRRYASELVRQQQSREITIAGHGMNSTGPWFALRMWATRAVLSDMEQKP